MNTKKYNLGIWVSESIWHIIVIDYSLMNKAEALCHRNKYSSFFSYKTNIPKWIYPYYNIRKDYHLRIVNVNKKTLCKSCLKLSSLSWEDITQYLINIKVGAINAKESQIRKNKITPNIQKFKR